MKGDGIMARYNVNVEKKQEVFATLNGKIMIK